jgi:hypothetical protein
VRGASALQRVLDQVSDPSLRVLIVWEPVLPTDVVAPLSAVLGRVRDLRAAQFWDPARQLSVALHRNRPGSHATSADDADIIWDFVGLYPAGVRWESDPPWPAFNGYPVVDVTDELQRRLMQSAR